MNATVLRALLRDALYQIQDNKVFRLLLVVSLVPVAFTFLIGFHEDAIQSGLRAAEELGGVRRPWRVAAESGRLRLPAEAERASA